MKASNKRRAVKVRRRLRRGTYLLPSMFTMGNIMLGFAAIVRGFAGDFGDAAILILFAVVLVDHHALGAQALGEQLK